MSWLPSSRWGTTTPPPEPESRAPARVEPPPLSHSLAEWGGRWAWRRRRELAPFWLLGGLVPAVLVGHLVAAWAWWLAGPVCAALAALVALRLHGGGDRAFVVRAGAPVAAWAALAWVFGLADPVLLGTGAVGGALICALWVRRSLPRSRLEIVGGSRWPWHWEAWCFRREARRELRAVLAAWPTTARLASIPGARIRRAVADAETGYEVHVVLARGQVQGDIKLPRLISALREFEFALEPGELPHEVVLREREAEERAAPEVAGESRIVRMVVGKPGRGRRARVEEA